MRAESQFSRTVGVFGLSEAAVTERLSDLLADSNPAVTLTARTGGEIALTISAAADEEARAQELCEPVLEDVRERLGAFVYGLDVPDLQTAVVKLLAEKHLEIATAESCTAGLLSGKLTQVPGASAVFECGIAAYSKEIKHDVLGVSEAIMDEQGTVCADTAAGMAIGVRRVGGSDIGVGITGEAGPHPSENKPVGTVFIALADNRRVWVKELHAAGDRDTIREIATCQALDLARRYLEALPAVMAGGQLLDEAVLPPVVIPQAAPTKTRRLLSSIFPWRGDSSRAIVFKSLLWAGIVAVIVAAFLLLNAYIWAPARNREQYVSLEQLYTQTPSGYPSGYSSDDFPEGMLARFYALYTQNPDIKGWVKVDGTGINYPVVQNSALDYSSLNFRRESSEYGVPYFDRNVNLSSPLAFNRSFIIHGNNTGDGQMFSDLLSYTDARFLMAHPTIEMNTIYATGTFEVFAVLYVDDAHPDDFNYRAVTFDGAEDFARFTDALCARSLFTTSVRPTEDDSLLLLTTDAASLVGVSNIRLVVAARLLPLGESAGEELTLSYNANVVLPASMLSSATSNTASVTTRTGYQSSDTLPAIDPPSDEQAEKDNAPSATGDPSESVTTTTPSDDRPTTTPSGTTTRPVHATDPATESAFYRTITVKIGDNMTAPIRTRDELQYAVASAVKSELGTHNASGNALEAYKAQAVSSYTYMLYTCRDGSVFSVPLSIDLENAADRRIYEAVGEVLGVKLADTTAKTVADTPLCALYFSSCNGFTANSHSVYTAALPYLRSVASPYDTDERIQKYSGGSDTLFSTFTITQEELLSQLGTYVRTLTGGTVSEVRLEEGGETPFFVKSRDAGGYVTRTNAYYVTNGQTVYLRGIDIRKALGGNALRSHSFTVAADGDMLTFTVAGHGLGLGMSQYGALAYADEAGFSWRQILTHYYSLSDSGRYRIVEPVWEARE